MKSSIAVLAFSLIITQDTIGRERLKVNDQRMPSSVGQVDSFNFYFKELKFILKKNPYDTSQLTRKAVKYMENVTKIKAHADGNYFGWFLFTKNDLTAWEIWKKNNQ